MPKVGDAIRLIRADGWLLARTRGSHRQYWHPVKPGAVTIAGRMSKDLAPGTWKSILRQAGLDKEKYRDIRDRH
ncbi:MAG: addiction module toxin, HicA family [Gammaproteobacteria bacterium]|nr:addiction module toxin, HicA family [Gammaproteobacteria bacterium]MYF61137.1 addiction module toxin, HicA family [Gammaproteobacteria bacterium]MYI21456.1 addiction module toxin, HicA family [Gammaproteobacteria bacterium]